MQKLNNEIPSLLNKEDVCEILDIHVQTLNTYMKDGLLPYVKLGNHKQSSVRFNATDVSKLISNQTKQNERNIY
jgi:predicted site-specific integrase-resolvase